MTNKMLKFVDVKQETPEKRVTDQRKEEASRKATEKALNDIFSKIAIISFRK